MALAKPYSDTVHLASPGISETQLQTRPLAPLDANLGDRTGWIEHNSWYAVFTQSHHEKCIAQRFAQQQIENFLPVYSQVHRWTNRRKVSVQLPLFPNYVFVRIDKDQRGQVLRVPGVLSIVGRGYDPTPLPDFEMESLRSGLHLRNFEPHPFLVAGTRVRIKVGPLEGMEGVLLRQKNNLRVVLTVTLINQSVAVEVDAGDIEPISRHAQVSCSAH